MDRRAFVRSAAQVATAAIVPAPGSPPSPASFGRPQWTALLERVAGPVLEAAARGRLQAQMPCESAPGEEANRRRVTALEAVARTLAGLAPWLEHGPSTGDEGKLRARFTALAQQSIAQGVAKSSPGYLRFGEDRQTIVDAGFLSLALARAPKTLGESLSAQTKSQLADALRATRAQTPAFSNWLLFAAMTEACLFQLGESWDRMRVDYALREHASWFLGDGIYGDGPTFHADYYNSYVIHPFLLALVDAVGSQDQAWNAMAKPIHARAVRYAAIQERVIASDGTFPVVGRSITYRSGAFHLLADIAQRESLPPTLAPAAVRCALGAVLERTLLAANTFDAQGWLRIGLAGHQPALGETYISTGSLYLCTAGLSAARACARESVSGRRRTLSGARNAPGEAKICPPTTRLDNASIRRSALPRLPPPPCPIPAVASAVHMPPPGGQQDSRNRVKRRKHGCYIPAAPCASQPGTADFLQGRTLPSTRPTPTPCGGFFQSQTRPRRAESRRKSEMLATREIAIGHSSEVSPAYFNATR